MNITHSLRSMNLVYLSLLLSIFLIFSCPHCHVLHWKEEILQNSTRANSRYSIYCTMNTIELLIANDIPKPIRVLLTETCVNVNDKMIWIDRIAHFQQNIRSYNNSITFISLNTKLDHIITDTINTTDVYIFRIHDVLYHLMRSLLSSSGERSWFAQVYLYDSAEKQLQFHHKIHSNLDPEILQLLNIILQDINPLIQFWCIIKKRIINNQQLTI
jgi:hypothetical protein